MWLKIDDGLIEHPKMYRAAAHLGGRSGRQRAFSVFMAGLSWSSRHLADGVIPDEVVRTFVVDRSPIDVAIVLAFDDVRLWHRDASSYRIHDYFHYNPSAETIKKKRDEDRLRKRVGGQTKGLSVGTANGIHAESGASRARDPNALAFSSSEDPGGSVVGVDKPDTFAAIVWAEVRAAFRQAGPAALADPKDVYLRICRIADTSTPPITYSRAQLDDEFSTACHQVEREWQLQAGRR
jgi:hypothetical protein